MKRALIAALASLTIAAGAAAAEKPKAAEKPNFSGEWKMNPAQSNFGKYPPPNSFVRKIEHADPALNIVEEQAAGGLNQPQRERSPPTVSMLRSN